MATGCHWTSDLTDQRLVPLAAEGEGILTPHDVFDGTAIEGPVVVYDFDQGTMGGCLAELLAERGHGVTFITPGDEVSGWTRHTHDQWYAQARLIELQVTIVPGRFVTGYDGSSVTTACKYSGRESALAAPNLLVVGVRRPDDALYRALEARPDDLTAAGIRSLQKIGDCDVPGLVAHATYAAHQLAREFDGRANERAPARVEQAALQP